MSEGGRFKTITEQREEGVQNPQGPVSLPPLTQQLKNVATTAVQAAKGVLQGGDLTVAQSEAERRMAICSGCPYYLAPREKCGVCGCNMAFKTRLVAGSCPKGKW